MSPPEAPLVTILIPTYNRPDLLSQAIASALAQTHAHIDLVVLDDASPDGGRTAEVVAPFLVDARVRYVRHASNIGIAANWRFGIAGVTGDFFCLLHDDDTFEPTFIAELLKPLLADPQVVLAFCDHWITDLGGVRQPAATERASATFGRDRLPAGVLCDFARTALIDTAIPIGATLFRRARVGPELIDENARGTIDMWLLFGCVASGGRAVYVPRRLMNYRSHPGGMSAAQPLYMSQGHLWRYAHMLADKNMSAIHPSLGALQEAERADYGAHLLAAGRRQEARRVLAGVPGRKAAVGRWLSRLGPFGAVFFRAMRQAKRLL